MVGQVDRRSLMGPSSFFSSSSSSSPDPDHGRPPKERSCERDYVKQANSAPLLLSQNSAPDRLRYYFTAKPISHRILGVKLASSFLIFILESALSRNNGVWRKNVNAPRRPRPRVRPMHYGNLPVDGRSLSSCPSCPRSCLPDCDWA